MDFAEKRYVVPSLGSKDEELEKVVGASLVTQKRDSGVGLPQKKAEGGK